MTNVVDLTPAINNLWLKKRLKGLDPLGLFVIDYDDIARQRGEAANGGPTDPLSYGPIAEPQVRRLTEAFGFPRLPATWGEFREMLVYCRMLHDTANAGKGTHLAERMRYHGLNVIRKYCPLDYQAAVAYYDGDIKRLRQIHSAENTLFRLGREHKEYRKPPRMG